MIYDQAHYLVITLFFCVSHSTAITHQKNSAAPHSQRSTTLDLALSNLYNQYPELAYNSAYDNNTADQFSSTNNLINIIALLYSAYHGYELYTTTYYQQEPLVQPCPNSIAWSTINYCADYVYPGLLKSLSNHTFFVGGLAKIFIKTLVYKTIAKLVLIGINGDIFDVIKYILHTK